MKKYRFAFVSNSAEVAQVVRAYVDPAQIDFQVHLETMESALSVANSLLDEGVEVILGGGATGKFLRLSLAQPVVTIARTHLDILRALVKAKQIGSFIGLASYKDAPEGLELFESLLNIHIRPIVFSSTVELVEGMRAAVTEGVHCFVGSGICQQIASSLGKEAFIVVPCQDSIIRALDEALIIAASHRKERQKAERLRIILESINEGVIGVDGGGNINILNRVASEKLNLEPASALGQPLPDIVKESGLLAALRSGQAEIDKIRNIAGHDVVISSLPIIVNNKIVAAVATFRLASRIKLIDQKLKESLSSKGFTTRYTLDDLKGDSASIQRIKAKAFRYAHADATLIIQGETGCGKEILAQSVHQLGDRRARPFVAVNCAALPENLLESELFGYEEGAFTGAKRGGKAGLFELASGGTIYLDEIADIPMSLQVRLLRVLEEKKIMRIGSDRVIPVDVRVISSSYKDLAVEVQKRTFRPDLFFRLSVLKLNIPPLRERKEDIPLIAQDLLARCGMPLGTLSKNNLKMLNNYDWPGNVRELDALIRRFALLLENPGHATLLLTELMEEMRSQMDDRESVEDTPKVTCETGGYLKDRLEAFEAELVRQVLKESRFSKKLAAHRLGISVNTLWRKLKEH